MPEGLPVPPGEFVAKIAISRKGPCLKVCTDFPGPLSRGGAYPLVVKANRHDLALTYVTFHSNAFLGLGPVSKSPAGEVKSMLDAEEKGISSRGRLDLLLEQLGIDVVSETLDPSP